MLIENYGKGVVSGVDIFGISKTNKAIFKEVTMQYRNYGLTNNLIVVRKV